MGKLPETEEKKGCVLVMTTVVRITGDGGLDLLVFLFWNKELGISLLQGTCAMWRKGHWRQACTTLWWFQMDDV
ncbi:hypothetical protein AV530_015666 [Patagioenas fasciata monilis]|uniref:Uncharacterized protein n=1 Tax=Patagioenas fasciata monilis TaxID=372326 RepID=A0A1V4KIE4_PATFA|nr:hypothetical protein AV530_015666 [Patagioenas fasciata monilis]